MSPAAARPRRRHHVTVRHQSRRLVMLTCFCCDSCRISFRRDPFKRPCLCVCVCHLVELCGRRRPLKIFSLKRWNKPLESRKGVCVIIRVKKRKIRAHRAKCDVIVFASITFKTSFSFREFLLCATRCRTQELF